MTTQFTSAFEKKKRKVGPRKSQSTHTKRGERHHAKDDLRTESLLTELNFFTVFVAHEGNHIIFVGRCEWECLSLLQEERDRDR